MCLPYHGHVSFVPINVNVLFTVCSVRTIIFCLLPMSRVRNLSSPIPTLWPKQELLSMVQFPRPQMKMSCGNIRGTGSGIWGRKKNWLRKTPEWQRRSGCLLMGTFISFVWFHSRVADFHVLNSIISWLLRFIISGDTVPYYRFLLTTMIEKGFESRELNIPYSHLLSHSKDLAMEVCNNYHRCHFDSLVSSILSFIIY